jgi:2',3'-cyclic-nucleotide 2'-phosphodiesterase (5'-nucleotidase family)
MVAGKRRIEMKKGLLFTGLFVFCIALALIVSKVVIPAFAADKDEEIVNKSELGETYMGDVVADAMKAAMDADIALVRGGALGYTDMPDKLTDKTIGALVPFDTDLVVSVKLKGDTLKRILEKSCSLLPRRSSTFLQISGGEYTCDPNQASGKRVSGIKIGGKALAPTKEYVVAVTEFLSGGGGGMKEFREGKVVNGDGMPIGEIVLKNAVYDQKNIDSTDGRITIIPVKEKE